MPRNVELIQQLFGSKQPLPSIELADNALKLGGIKANLYALKTDLNGQVEVLLGNIDELIKDLDKHKADDVRHLTPEQIAKIANAINASKALEIANDAIDKAKPSIISKAVQDAEKVANEYTDTEVATLKAKLEKQIGDLNVPTITNPDTGEQEKQPISNALEQNPQKLINPEYFYRFKNMINNSSFEVFNGTTLVPLGWDNGVVSEDASMFQSHSLKLTSGQTAKQTTQHQADVTWMKGAYDTNDVILCFYHKFDAVIVKVYDVVNEQYLSLTELDSDLSELRTGTVSVEFPYAKNWNQYRCMVKFTPQDTTEKIRVEFTCKSGGTKGECYIDAPSMEPFVEGEYPSIYKDGLYSISAYQLLNPPPGDVDRFTPLEHLSVAESTADDKGNITYQKLTRSDGSTAIERQASNPDANGYYKTFVETFYKKNGTTINYVDTYNYTYSATGAVLTRSKSTTEEAS